MQVTETLSEGLKRGFAVIVPASDIEDKRTKRLAEIGKTVKLPGFRPGKVPMAVVRQRYGTAVMAEVLEESVNAATQQVLTDRGLRAASQPKVDVTSLDDSRTCIHRRARAAARDPDARFRRHPLTRLKAEPPDEAVDKALAEHRRAAARARAGHRGPRRRRRATR